MRGSSICNLDADAIRIARNNYKNKQNRDHISAEIDKMSDEEFLTKIGLLMKGKLTRAAMVLLGNPDHANILDVPVRVMWRLYGSNGIVKDYKELNIPFITVVDRAYVNIRNLTYRYLPDVKTLFPTITQQYDMDLLRELMNNCIAHMDYTIGGRIYLDEFEDIIVISNPGSFIPKDVRNVLKTGYRAPYYRNQLLSDAMRVFDMIDTVQMGILRVFNIQRNRYFPLPDYDVHSPNEVSVRVYGKILNENYTRLLFNNIDLDIDTVLLLDRVQKKLPIDKDQYKKLREHGMVQGRIPNVDIAVQVYVPNDILEHETKNKIIDDKYYMDLIIFYLQQCKEGKRSDFIKLLQDKFPSFFTEKQKINKVRNLLALMKRNGSIKYINGNTRAGIWVLTKNDVNE